MGFIPRDLGKASAKLKRNTGVVQTSRFKIVKTYKKKANTLYIYSKSSII